MSTASLWSSRACDLCRAAKQKCDGTFPACGRCTSRGALCTGMILDPDSHSVFRNQNQAAKQGSEQARRRERREKPDIIPLQFEASSATSPSLHDTASFALEVSDRQLHKLHERPKAHATDVIPLCMTRDPGTRAVERFFVDWVSLSRDDGVAAGHERDVPDLYSKSNPDSLLWFAARAMSFAHVSRRGLVQDSSSALRLYGEALAGLRNLALDGHAFASDGVLTGLLLVDAFESVYLNRRTPLGSHSAAVLYSLRARTDKQLYERSQYFMWCTAHHRLQARQLLLNESPVPEQDAWLAQVSLPHFPMVISSKINTMLHFSAAVRGFFQITATDAPDKVVEAAKISDDGIALFNSLDEWETGLSPIWKLGQHHHNSDLVSLSSTRSSSSPSSRNHVFRQFWLRCTWCFYWACEVMASESLVKILDTMSKSSTDAELNSKHRANIQAQQTRIKQLCDVILKYTQQLAELLSYEDSPIRISPQAYMTTNSSVYIVLTVVQRTRSSSSEQKRESTQVLQGL